MHSDSNCASQFLSLLFLLLKFILLRFPSSCSSLQLFQSCYIHALCFLFCIFFLPLICSKLRQMVSKKDSNSNVNCLLCTNICNVPLTPALCAIHYPMHCLSCSRARVSTRNSCRPHAYRVRC